MKQAIRMKHLPYAVAVAISVMNCNSLYAEEATVKLPEVVVDAKKDSEPVRERPLNSADMAEVLAAEGSLQFYQSGGVSALPVIRGLNDDRIKILVDGAEVTAACGNHMNSPLSYVAPATVANASVLAGITPVSQGGDSIAGTILLTSPPPVFAGNGETLVTQGRFSSLYRSNNNAFSTALSASVANDSLSLGFTGTIDRAGSYEDGRGNKVRSTQFDRRTQTVNVAARGEDQLLTVKLTHQDVPFQGYVNQYMDLINNQSDAINIGYSRKFAWGDLDTRLYWQNVNHEMGFFSNEKTGTMPMKTKGEDMGYSVKATVPLDAIHTLRIGNEAHRQKLDDFWPAVPGSMMMGPQTYVNLNNGRRDRVAVYAEVASSWSNQWRTLLGLREDVVHTSTGEVQSYGGMMNATDTAAAQAFNAGNRSRTDQNIDVTAMATYIASNTASVDFGYARKNRAPSLYERYSWGRGTMAMTMIGWFGDANGYVGDPDLKPETANTISATLNLHDAAQAQWELKLTPYYTYVQDYIGVNRIGTFNLASGVPRALLQFQNQDAQFYGVEAAFKRSLWDNARFGQGRVIGSLGWTRGERVSNGDDLYHIMPLQFKALLEQRIGAWSNVIDLQLVDSKTAVDSVRFESKTAGYTLVNLRTGYQWKKARLDLGVTNLFDKFYYLPLGGADYANWNANGGQGAIGPVAGMGRSVNVGLSVDF
jgi:iron complex outermembrane recepter protein